MGERLTICDTSPLQYLFQLGQLSLLPRLLGDIAVPPAVVQELDVGRSLGIHLPDLARLSWLTVHTPPSPLHVSQIPHLGPGEREVLALATHHPKTLVILDDNLARRAAKQHGIPMTGTLGILLKAKASKEITDVAPLLDQLHLLGFRLNPATRTHVLSLAEESP